MLSGEPLVQATPSGQPTAGFAQERVGVNIGLESIVCRGIPVKTRVVGYDTSQGLVNRRIA